MTYYVVLALLVLLALPTRAPSPGARSWLALLLLLAFGGLRTDVGTDWEYYTELFREISEGADLSEFREERGYLFLNWLVAIADGGVEVFIFLIFFIAVVTKFSAVSLFNARPSVALLLYFSGVFLIYDVNGLRQGLAMGLVMLSGYLAYRKQLPLFLLSIALAASFHVVALIAAPVYAIARRRFFIESVQLRLSLLWLGAVATYVVGSALSTWELQRFLEPFNLRDHYEYYIFTFDKEFSLFSPGTLQRLALMTLVGFYIHKVRAPRAVKALLFNCHVAAVFVYFLFHFNAEFMARASYYYKAFDLITLPLILASFERLEERAAFYCLLVALAFMQVYQILSIPDGGLLPYKNILF